MTKIISFPFIHVNSQTGIPITYHPEIVVDMHEPGVEVYYSKLYQTCKKACEREPSWRLPVYMDRKNVMYSEVGDTCDVQCTLETIGEFSMVFSFPEGYETQIEKILKIGGKRFLSTKK